MEFKQLYYFVEVARYGSFSQASKMLYITPQALSKSISQLEKEYNCQLFLRRNNALSLSDIGLQILSEAKDLVEHYYQIDQRLKQLSEIERGCFTVAIAQHTLNIVDIDLFDKFNKQYPQLCAEYVELPDKLVDEYMESDRVEVCFNINELPNQDDYESILVFPSEICVFERYRNFLKGRDQVTLEDISDQKIVVKSEIYKTFDILDEAAKEKGIDLNYVLKTADETLMMNRLSSKECIGIGVYSIGRNMEFNEDPAVPFVPALHWSINMSYKKYKAISKPVQLFIKFIQENYCS